MTSAISSMNWKNGTLKRIDITAGELETVRGILSRFVPDREVRAFGSRVSRTAKAFSDLDLAVMGDSAIPSSVVADLKEAFSESSLPFKVDVVDWATTKENFRRIIEKEYVAVQDGKAESGAGNK